MSQNYLICSSISIGETIEILAIDIFSTDISLKPLKTNLKSKSVEFSAVKLVTNKNLYFIAHSSLNTHIFQIHLKKISQILSVARSNVISVMDSSLFTAYYDKTNLAKIYNLKNGDLIATLKLHNPKISTLFSAAPLVKIQVLASDSGSQVSHDETPTTIYQILATRKDCRVEFYEAVSGNNEEILTSMDWVRFEGLSDISSVEMLDLPLSESQARIETEFGAENGNVILKIKLTKKIFLEAIIKSFFLRVTSQLEQLRRFFPILGQRFAESLELLTRKQTSFTNVLRHLVGYDIRTSRKSRTATISINSPQTVVLERDYFNLQKLIIVTTLSSISYFEN